MLKNYFSIAWRNLLRNRASSFINITGLAVGMAVAILIGIWIWDELSFNTFHQHYDRIAQVMENDVHNGNIHTESAIPLPLDAEMRKSYGNYFEHIVMASWNDQHVLAAGDKKNAYPGTFIGADAPDMLGLDMLAGSRNGLSGPSSIMLSKSVAGALFGDADPINKTVLLDNKASFNVSGVYDDLPYNTSFHEIAFMAPWDFFTSNKDWIERDPNNWNDNSLFMYVQLTANADMANVSEKIKNIKLNKLNAGEARIKPQLFLQPMSKWHLYSSFKNGVNTGGAIQYVWLFGVIGIFVLLLACINFMNLSTARSEKRAKEVGIRKAVGSLRKQLISQFFCESLFVSTLAFALSLLLAWIAMPFFNEVANKNMTIPLGNPVFWLISTGFSVFTGFVAGSYPAIYLSSFNPVKVLKGIFKAGRLSALPRKALVVLQFSVSVVLMIGTIVVFKQIQFAKNRPIGYSRAGLVAIETTNDDLNKVFYDVRNDLLNSGAVAEVAESSSPTTALNNDRGDISWKGKDPSLAANFGNVVVTTEFGKTVGWQFVDGRDFSNRLHTDSNAVVINEAAAKFIGFKNPVGEIISVGKREMTIVGVVKDMVMSSPYEPVKQTIFRIGYGHFDNIIIKLNPISNAHDALDKVAGICKTYSPSVPFSCKFADEEYAKKFMLEERVGKLANVFAFLAIFISCLGLFGMASFMAEQRVKEIGVRKVLGASAFNLWRLLSKDFLVLVLIALLVAAPVAYYFMQSWLQHYTYHTQISWWIFFLAGATAIVITLLTVSFQAIKAANANPVKSLRTE